jgi:hypothetical protein
MKVLIGAAAAVIGLGVSLSLALANPDMIPKHPGYPSKASTSPVTGQALANDPGQANAVGAAASLEAAGAEKHVEQKLSDPNNQRLVGSQGAGQLPKVSGPQIMINPPVKEGTRMK